MIDNYEIASYADDKMAYVVGKLKFQKKERLRQLRKSKCKIKVFTFPYQS